MTKYWPQIKLKIKRKLFSYLMKFFEKKFSNYFLRFYTTIKIKNNKILDRNKSIYFSRNERIDNFLNGINYRLNELQKEYLTEKIIINSGDLIIDCGANIGEFSLFFEKYNDIKVCAFEPDLREFEILNKNLTKETYTTYNIALSDNNTYETLYLKNDTGDTSLLDNGSKNTTKVECKTLDSFSFGKIKLLKVEAEGHEEEILNGAKESLRVTEYVTVDCGPEKYGKPNFDEIIRLMQKMNFHIINFNHNRKVFLFKNSIHN